MQVGGGGSNRYRALLATCLRVLRALDDPPAVIRLHHECCIVREKMAQEKKRKGGTREWGRAGRRRRGKEWLRGRTDGGHA